MFCNRLSEKRPFKIVGIGELLWDMLPYGRQLGGAPANFVYYCSQLNMQACLVSAVGNDELGSQSLLKLSQAGVDTEYIQTLENKPTGTVDVKLDTDGKPEYTINENVAWDYIKFDKKLTRLARQSDAVCFGSISQRSKLSRNSVMNFLKNTGNGCLRIFDINLRQDFYSEQIINDSLALANVLKINDEELVVVAEMFGIKGTQSSCLGQLAKKKSLETIIFTRGANGSIIYHKGQINEHPGVECKPIDTVGAGDSFTAVAVVGLLSQKNIEQINQQANKLAAFVCENQGAMVSQNMSELDYTNDCD